jgi:hypothetical protein
MGQSLNYSHQVNFYEDGSAEELKKIMFSVISVDRDFCLERTNIRNGLMPYLKDA